MDKVELINKIVACKNPSLIEFMYPSFMVKSEIFYDYENDIIYSGKLEPGIKNVLAHGTRNFISLVGVPDVDFDNREIQISVLYSKWNKTPSAKVLEVLSKDMMTDDDFMSYFKKYWVLGTSKLDKDEGLRLYDIYKHLGKSRYDLFKTYFALREVYSDKSILSCVLGFIEKAYNPDMVTSTNGNYLKMLSDFNKAMEGQLKQILFGLYSLKTSDLNYKIMWLLYRLGKGEII